MRFSIQSWQCPFPPARPEIWPLRLKLGLGKTTSYAIVPGIRQVKKTRLMDIIDLADDQLMQRLDRALNAYLSD